MRAHEERGAPHEEGRRAETEQVEQENNS